jgi:hypothetical protein
MHLTRGGGGEGLCPRTLSSTNNIIGVAASRAAASDPAVTIVTRIPTGIP